MAIYVRCKGNGGKCKTFNSPEVKKCRKCGANLDELKANGASYYVYVRIDGKLKPKSFPTLKKAQAYEAEVEKAKASGREFELKFELDLTVSSLCDWYLHYRKEGHGKKIKNAADMERALEQVKGFFNSKPVLALVPADIESYQMARELDGKAGDTIDRETVYLRAAINKAVINRKLPEHAKGCFEDFQKKGGNRRKKVVGVAEFVKLYQNATDHCQDILVSSYFLGTRKGELRTLTWRDVDFQNNVIRIKAENAKTNEDRTIPILPPVQAILRNRLPENADLDEIQDLAVFSHNGEAVNRKAAWTKCLQDACEKAKIPYGTKVEGGVFWHAFRHTLDSALQEAGVQDSVRRAIIGHKAVGMDGNYLHPTKVLHEAMGQFWNWFLTEMSTLANVNTELSLPAPLLEEPRQ
jgi:integrase